MEPLAPGTEDEVPISYSSATKQEKEKERLLSICAILPNGRYGNVFELKYINGAEHWYCNACACPVMGWVFHHEMGKRHKSSLGNTPQQAQPMQDSFFPFQMEPQQQQIEFEEPTLQIAPGEPAPPGFEGQVEKVALIQDRLDVFNVGPLVALEYLLELRDYDSSKEPLYLCILCDKKGDPRTVLTHLASYKHILQYLQKHFPTCYRALAPYMTKQYKRNWQQALHEVAEAIEKKFGRLRPMPVDADRFEKDQVYYLQLIAKGRHFSELSGYTFEEYINKDELTKVHEDESDKFALQPRSALTNVQQKKKSPSPPFVQNPIKKIKCLSNPATNNQATSSKTVGNRRRSLSSVSSVSSSDLSDFDESGCKKNNGNSNFNSGKDKKYDKPTFASTTTYKKRSRSRSPYGRRRSPPRRATGTSDYYRRTDNERRTSRDRERDLLPWERSNYKRNAPATTVDNKKIVRNDKLDEYKKLCKAIDTDMERVLKQHKKNPEKHPQYNDEWKKFWNKRYKELQADGKDVSTYDFKPEWIEFWNKRIIELHQGEVKVKKDALKKRLGLPEEPAPISFKIVPKKKIGSTTNTTATTTSKSLKDTEPDEIIIIDDRDDDTKSSKRSHSPWEDESLLNPYKKRSDSVTKRRSKSRDSRKSKSPKYRRSYSRSPPPYKKSYDYRKERIRVVSDLPWERERRSYRHDLADYYKPPSVLRDVTREPVLMSTLPPPPVIQEDEEEDTEMNVVSVLRLLTALEEKLGSLGPKIIDLLAQALAMEKNEANSSEIILDNEINCVLFETVKEKLKGQLLAGLVDKIQERAFKNAIKKTASLIHLSSERKKEKQKLTESINLDPVKVTGIGSIDKKAIAKQIANALVAQGKTDVTQSELEQLINAVVGMAEASKTTGKLITTANFLEQLTQKPAVDEKPQQAKQPSPPSPPPPPPPQEKKQEIVAVPVTTTTTTTIMDGLSDSDLQTLLQNFKDLSTEEQHGLINYLKKLEAHEPDRVERLRKFVNLGGQNSAVSAEEKRGRESPFSNRTGSVNPTADEPATKMDRKEASRKILDSDDEEDYTFEDVVKAASKNIKQKELEEERKIVEETIKISDLNDTKLLISNIMSNINKSANVNLLGLGTSDSIDLTSSDLAKTIKNLPVSISSLANIVGSVKNMTTTCAPTQQPKFFETTRSYQPEFGQQPQQFYQNRPNVAYPIKGSCYNYEQQQQQQQRHFVGQQPNFAGQSGFGSQSNFNSNFGTSQFANPQQQQQNYGATRGGNYNNRW